MIQWGQHCFLLSGDSVGDEVAGPFRVVFVLEKSELRRIHMEVSDRLGTTYLSDGKGY